MDRGVCKGCHKPIIWIRNENGRAEPFDAAVSRALVMQNASGFLLNSKKVFVQEEDAVEAAHLPHFVTCPDADQFRKKRKD